MFTGASSVSSENGQTHSTVMELVQKYLQKGHALFTDNFYTSPQLYLDMLNNGTYACGIIRQNRKYYPSELRHITRKRPGYKFATYKLFTASIWHDRRDVTFPSTLQCFH